MFFGWIKEVSAVVMLFFTISLSSLVFAQNDAVPVPKLSPNEIAVKAIESVKKRQSWDTIEIQEADKSSYTLILWYKVKPASISVVERDTKVIASALLKVLLDTGVDPMESWISVFVHARMHMTEKSVTGKDQVMVFGKTMYDFNSDKLVFKSAN